MTLSSPTLNARLPLGVNRTPATLPSWPRTTRREDPLAAFTNDTDPVDVLAAAKKIDQSLFTAYAGVPLLERTGAVVTAAGVGGVAYTSQPNGLPPAFWTWTPPQP